MFQVGIIIGGRLRIDRILGAGGMGVVAAATHLELGHHVAVKVLRDELAEDPTIVERFIREARAVVGLRTEHVCRVFDVGRLDSGAPYIVMELLDGSDLQRAIAARPMPATTAADYILQACVALAEAHAAGIVHRDLKPANLFVTRRLDGGPLVKVLDFGIAKAIVPTGPQLTQATGMMGSPGYMSPEQLQSARDVDLRTDIWALGVTLYQLVSGRMPFSASTLTEIAVKVATDPPAPLEVEPNLKAVIERCLQKLPEHRYATVAALANDLSRSASTDGRRAAALAMQLGGSHVEPARAHAPVPPPPLVRVDAATAASVASRQGSTVASVESPHGSTVASVVSPPRGAAVRDQPLPVRSGRRWPLLIGVVGLVGATVAVTLVVARGGGGTAPSTAASKAHSAEPQDAAATVLAPADAPVTIATRPAPMPTGRVDSWAPVDGGPEPDAAPPVDAAVAKPKPLTYAEQVKQGHEQQKESCREMVKDARLASMPMMQFNVGHCWCVLGDRENALVVHDLIQDKNMRRGLAQMCMQYGVKL